jgi:hypothetical protein
MSLFIPDPFMGEFLHAQEDTYAHSTGIWNRNWNYYGNWGIFENGGLVGHACHGHKPDHTWEDTMKTMMMARRVYEDLKCTFANNDAYPDPGLAITDPPDPFLDDSDSCWNKIRGTIYEFAGFKPQTVFDPFEDVTLKGYEDKIRILFPGYKIDPSVDAFLFKRASITGLSTSLNVGGYSVNDITGGL